MMYWVIKCLKNYACFRGRAGLRECWTFVAFWLLLQFGGLGLDIAMGWRFENVVDWIPWFPTFEISRLLLVVPTMAVTSRRLHDVGESGSLTLLWFIPVIGWFVLLPLLAKNGDVDDNQFGPPESDVRLTPVS